MRTKLNSHAVKISWSEPYIVVSTNDMSFSVFRYRAQTRTDLATLVQAYSDVVPRPSSSHEIITIPWPKEGGRGPHADTLMGGVADEGPTDHPESLTLILAAAHDRSLTLHALHPRRPEDDDYCRDDGLIVADDDDDDGTMAIDAELGTRTRTRRRREQPHRAARNVPCPTLILASTSSERPLPYELTSLAVGDFRAVQRRMRKPTRDPSYARARPIAAPGGGTVSATSGFLLGDVEIVGTSPTGATVHAGVIRGAHARALRFLVAVLARLGSEGVAPRGPVECERCAGAGGHDGEGGGAAAGPGSGRGRCACAKRPIPWWEPARPLREAWRDGGGGAGEAVGADGLRPLPYVAGAPAGVGPGAAWLEGILREGRRYMGFEVRMVCGQMERDLGVGDWVGEVVRLWRLAIADVL